MKILEKQIDEIFPYGGNPRKTDGAVAAVAESIKRFGFKVPIVVDANMVIIAGHTRLEAAKKVGLEKVPVIVAEDLSEDQAKAFRLADNKTAEIAVWDFEKLEEELDAIDADGWLLNIFRADLEDRAMAAENKEIDLGEFGEEGFKYECENCGFRFN